MVEVGMGLIGKLAPERVDRRAVFLLDRLGPVLLAVEHQHLRAGRDNDVTDRLTHAVHRHSALRALEQMVERQQRVGLAAGNDTCVLVTVSPYPQSSTNFGDHSMSHNGRLVSAEAGSGAHGTRDTRSVRRLLSCLLPETRRS
jgi:hypothetical protein